MNKETNFFRFLIKQSKQNKIKQNKNKIKRLRARDSPCRSDLSPRQRRQKNSLMHSKWWWCWSVVGKPQEEGMMSTAASFPSIYETEVYRPVGERRLFWRCCEPTNGRAHYRRQQQRGNLHTNNQNTLHQLFSEVVKLTGFAEHKGLNVLCGWRIVCRKLNRSMQ